MTAKNLDLVNVVSVTIQGTPSLLSLGNINTLALFSTETPSWSGSASFKIYTNPTDVATDFGSSSKAAAIATAVFSQVPNPLNSNGYLVIINRGVSEKTKDAIIRTKDLVYYFGVIIDEEMHSVATDFAALATYIQSVDKMFFYASSNTADYAPAGMLDLVRSASEVNVRCLYYSDGTSLDTQLMAAAYASRALSTDFSGSNTATTLHMKSLVGVVPDTTVDQTALTAVGVAGVDVYVNVAGVPCIFTSGSNSFFDQIYNQFWFKFALQTAGFNYLRGITTKIPQTEKGMEGLKNEYRKVCDAGISNGFLAHGSWTSPLTFGDPEALIRSIKDIGYYVYSIPISQQLTADRTARLAPTVQIAAKSAGAIHKSNVVVNINL